MTIVLFFAILIPMAYAVAVVAYRLGHRDGFTAGYDQSARVARESTRNLDGAPRQV